MRIFYTPAEALAHLRREWKATTDPDARAVIAVHAAAVKALRGGLR